MVSFVFLLWEVRVGSWGAGLTWPQMALKLCHYNVSSKKGLKGAFNIHVNETKPVMN